MHSSQRFASGKRLSRGCRENEPAFMTYDHNALPLLRNPIVDGAEQPDIDIVTEASQLPSDLVKIPSVPVHHPSYVLEHPKIGP